MISTAASAKLDHCKRRLDEIFGPYDQFATFITQPGILSRPIYGVVEMADDSVMDDGASNEPPDDCERPSTSNQIPTEAVLQSMQELVPPKPLTGLECSDGYSCVAKQQEAQLQNGPDEGISMEIESSTVANGTGEHSPDSGFTEGSACNEEHNPPSQPPAAWPPTLEVERIIKNFVHVSPLLSPIHTSSYLKEEVSSFPKEEASSFAKEEVCNGEPSESIKMDEDMDIDEPDSPATEPKIEAAEFKAAKPVKVAASPAPPKSKTTVNLSALSIEHRKKLFIRWKRPADVKPTKVVEDSKQPRTPTPPVKKTVNTTVNTFEASQPEEKASIEKPPSGTVPSVEYYKSRARSFKHSADQETDKVRKALTYLESVVFFLVASSHPDAEHRLIADTASFLRNTATVLSSDKHSSSRMTDYFKQRVKILSLMVQACLAYQTYIPRSEQAKKNYAVLTKYEAEQSAQKSAKPGSTGSTNNDTPSPASSTHSSNHTIISGPSPVKDTMLVPTHIHNIQTNQNHMLSHLMWAHAMWGDAKRGLQGSAELKEFVDRLNRLCGELWLDTQLKDVAEYLLTAVKWLQKEHELMKSASSSRKST